MPVLAPLRLALPARRPRSPAPPHTLASASLHSDSNGGRQPQLASPLAGASPRDSRRRAGVRRWVPPRPLPPPPRRTSGPRGALCAESSRPRAGAASGVGEVGGRRPERAPGRAERAAGVLRAVAVPPLPSGGVPQHLRSPRTGSESRNARAASQSRGHSASLARPAGPPSAEAPRSTDVVGAV